MGNLSQVREAARRMQLRIRPMTGEVVWLGAFSRIRPPQRATPRWLKVLDRALLMLLIAVLGLAAGVMLGRLLELQAVMQG